MALQEAMPGTAKEKRSCSFRGELRGGISKKKKILNRKVRHQSKTLLQNADYKRICRTGRMVEFT